MFKHGPKPKTELDKAIDKVFLEMEDESADSPEYAKMSKQLSKLMKLRERSRRQIDPNTALTVAANLAGILTIVTHERAHVLTSRALNFVMKASR